VSADSVAEAFVASAFVARELAPARLRSSRNACITERIG
jgi:hypothetical protein